MRRLPVLVLSFLCASSPLAARAAAPTPPDFHPDPAAVQRYGPAYRYPQAGWIVLHIEGEPYERGVQHGRLLAPEIAAQVRCLAERQSPKAPADGWKATRTLVNSLFLRRYDPEYLEEMKGIADGATAAGARFDGRPIDLVDIVAINAWAEIMTLDEGLAAEPTGLEGLRCIEGERKTGGPSVPPQPKPEHCSAFAAIGPATADGKIVFGHITMYLLYASTFFNVWLDVKTAKGHRVLMQSYPGGIQSGLDYYLNDAGILCRRDDHRPDALRRLGAGRGVAHPQGAPVRRQHRQGGRDPQGAEQRPVHQRMAARRHEDERDRHVRAGHAEEQAVPQLEERVVRRHGRLLLGLQQHEGPGRAAGDDRRRAVRPAGERGVSSVGSRSQMAGTVRQVQGQDRRRLRQAGVHDAADRRLPLGGREVHDLGHGQGAEDVGAVRAAAGPDLAADAAGAGELPGDRAAGRQPVGGAERRRSGRSEVGRRHRRRSARPGGRRAVGQLQ